ncbi:hypothetical protein [Baaleninema sp.]|uniref:hypothetical protein n=1 Tax=Baaleninema sp. TaxID=3101197 RepID=UPI003D085FA1
MALVVQKSPETLVRKDIAVLNRRIKGLAQKSQIGKWLPEIPGISKMPGIWRQLKCISKI